jgi:thiamine transport system permease protein
MAMPLVIPALRNRIETYKIRYAQLCQVLGLTSAAQFKFVYWPAIKGVLPWSFALSLVLSIGDLGVGVMVGSASFVTLPILIYQAIGSYQMVLAAQLTLLLLLICSFILFIAEWAGENQTDVKS